MPVEQREAGRWKREVASIATDTAGIGFQRASERRRDPLPLGVGRSGGVDRTYADSPGNGVERKQVVPADRQGVVAGEPVLCTGKGGQKRRQRRDRSPERALGAGASGGSHRRAGKRTAGEELS